MYVTFQITHEGTVYHVEGTSDWRGFVEPIMGPQPNCAACHGTGVVPEGYEPPDEWNDEGETIYGPCDCADTFEVDPGLPGEPVFVVDSIQCWDENLDVGDENGYLSESETEALIAEVGKQLLAERAHEEACACQG